MKQNVITELSTPELLEKLEGEQKHLIKVKMNHAVSPLDNPMKLKESKRTIARIKTEIRKRESDLESPATTIFEIAEENTEIVENKNNK